MAGVGTTHHVKLGGHYYLIKPYSYSKRSAPQFGARFTTGDPDYNNLSMWQHWAQRCFVGGMDADLFADDAMYDEGIGVNTTEHEKVTLARDLARGAGANWTVSAGSTNAGAGLRFFVYNNTLFVLTFGDIGVSSRLWKYDPGTDGWVNIALPATMSARSVATFDGKVFIGGGNTSTTLPMLIYGSGALSAWTTATNPSGLNTSDAVFGMRAFQQRLYVAYGTKVWRMKDDQTWDGNTVFYKANQNSDSNRIVSMETHLGFLYFLSSNGHIHRTDGNSTFDIWSWDGQTEGVAIRSFDGRLFVLTFEYTNTADVGYGCLYQMSGSAVTELKRWGSDTQATRIGNMTVFDRKLWYGASNCLGIGVGFGVAAYDPIEDAHSVFASNADTVSFGRGALPYANMIVDDQIFFQGQLFVVIRGWGAFKTPYKPRATSRGFARYDSTRAGPSVAAQNGGWFTTSTYDAGTPGLRKLWRKVVIDCTIVANTAIVVEYSTDDGATWTALPGITTVGTRKQVPFWLENVISVSLKLRITLRSTNSTASPTLWGFVVSYLPVVEPNWQWNFTIILAEKMELLDGTTASVDTVAELAFLRDAFRTKQLLNFVDLDSSLWASGGQPGVLVYDIDFRVADPTSHPLEGEVVVTLLEAVETY